MSDERIKARIAKLEKDIMDYPCWGAAIAAMGEELRNLKRQLKLKDVRETET